MNEKLSQFNLGGELQHEIMAIFWRGNQNKTVREVTFCLNKKRTVAYTTVLTIMTRLVKKGWLARFDQKQPYQYQARYSESNFYRSLAGAMLDKIRQNFGSVAIACFVEQTDQLDRQKLKKILEKLES